jgi:hypothetical protein
MRSMWSPGTIPPTGSPFPMRSSSWRQQRFGTTSECRQTCLHLVRRRMPPTLGPGEGLSDGCRGASRRRARTEARAARWPRTGARTRGPPGPRAEPAVRGLGVGRADTPCTHCVRCGGVATSGVCRSAPSPEQGEPRPQWGVTEPRVGAAYRRRKATALASNSDSHGSDSIPRGTPSRHIHCVDAGLAAHLIDVVMSLDDRSPAPVSAWDDPTRWPRLSAAAIELVAHAFRRHLLVEPDEPSPRRPSHTDLASPPAAPSPGRQQGPCHLA